LAVRAGGGIQAGVGQAQALDGDAAEKVRLDDFIDIGEGNVAVPNGFGVDDDRGTVFALIEAPGFIGAYRQGNSRMGQAGLEGTVEAGGTSRVTAAARMSVRALIGANEDVLQKFGHGAGPFDGCRKSCR
jgi:hypothetical protein